MTDVSVIIVNYNTRQLTSDCLESIFAHTSGLRFEVIVVDNASTDSSRETFCADNRIKYIYNENNLGFGPANNEGIRTASGKYIFLLNSDTLLTNNAVWEFFNYDERHGCDKVLGCQLRDDRGAPNLSFGRFPTVFRSLRDVFVSYFRHNPPVPVAKSPEQKVDFITGADLFIPRTVLDACGLFDDRFFMYFEETDLQKRMAASGFERIVISGPGIIHFGGGSTSDAERAAAMRYGFARSLFIYMKKHCNAFSYIVFRSAYALLRLVPAIIKREDRRTKSEFIKLLFARV